MLMKNNNKHVQSCFLTIAREKECACKMGGYKNAEAFCYSFIDYRDYWRTQIYLVIIPYVFVFMDNLPLKWIFHILESKYLVIKV